jgi:ribonuclease E
MNKKMLIDATHAEETRVVVVDGNKVEEFDFESLNKRQLAGNIYLAKVTRVEPSLQAAFVDYGGNRHGFLAFSEIHPDYYQIPKADREALLREEAEAAREEEEAASRPRNRGRGRPAAKPEAAPSADATVSAPAEDEAQAFAGPPSVIEGEPADAPPPGAASGEIEIDVPDEPAAESGMQPPAAEEGEYESVGGDDVAEERAPASRASAATRSRKWSRSARSSWSRSSRRSAATRARRSPHTCRLAGRYCVLMPNTARGGGISRKITNAADRKKLKEISTSITVPEGAASSSAPPGANRTKTRSSATTSTSCASGSRSATSRSSPSRPPRSTRRAR